MITKALLGVILALTLAGGVQTWRLHSAETDAAKARAELSDALAAWEKERARQLEAAREREQQHAAELYEIAAKYEQERANADAQRERELAALRDGTVRLRRLWQGCEAAAGSVPGTGPSPGESDAAAELRRQGIADVLRVVRQCDAHVRGLQAVIQSR